MGGIHPQSVFILWNEIKNICGRGSDRRLIIVEVVVIVVVVVDVVSVVVGVVVDVVTAKGLMMRFFHSGSSPSFPSTASEDNKKKGDF